MQTDNVNRFFVQDLNGLKQAFNQSYAMLKDSGGKLFRLTFEVFSVKTREQEEKYHAMLHDIAVQSRHVNRLFDDESWKRLCIAQFANDCIANDIDRCADYFKKHKIELVPSLDGKSLVMLGVQSRKFPQYVASAFIEWLYQFGAENQIVWTDPKYQDEYERVAA